MYFVASALLFGLMLVWHGVSRRATVLALAATFSNTVMIGVPLIGLAYGQAGLIMLFTLISVHALVLLTFATLALELAVARELALASVDRQHLLLTLLGAVRGSLIHPVSLPIIVGLAFAQTGLQIPALLDRPLQLLSNAFGLMALVLVGITLAFVRVGDHLRAALSLSLIKNLI